MDRVWRARIVAGLAFAGAAALAWLRIWGAAIAVFTTGAAAILLVVDRDVPARLPDRGAQGSVRSLAGLARELRLEGRGIVVPTPRGASLYVPAVDAAGAPPPRDVDVALHLDAASRGVQMAPPGAGLEAWLRERATLPTGAGIAEAADHLRRAFPLLDAGRDVRVARAGQSVRVTYVPGQFADLCRETREGLAPWHVQGGCPACSLAAILVAQAHGKPVRMKTAGVEGERVFLELEVLS